MARTKKSACKLSGDPNRVAVGFKNPMLSRRKKSTPVKSGKVVLNRDVGTAIKRAKRRRPGALALKEIRQYQNGGKDAYKLLIPKMSFWRYAREVLANVKGPEFRWSVGGITALQEAVEAFLVGMFDDAYQCTIHAKRVTLFVKDLHLARRIRGDDQRDYRHPHL